MSVMQLESYAHGEWIAPSSNARRIHSAVTGKEIAAAGSSALNFQDMIDYAKNKGGPKLRSMTFHDRARMVKALAVHLQEHRKALYELSYMTGATLGDSKIDIDGGIGTLMVFASKGRREMPDDTVYIDGEIEMLSRNGTFLGQHVCTPLQGVAIHINAYNFPVWGMLEKLAPTLLAGVPAIVKPATATSYLTEACFRLIIESGILPEGAVQLIVGSTGNLLDLLGSQDAVSFTGSAETALTLRSNHNILQNSVRFVAEQDSLNASVLGPDAVSGTPEFELFIKEAVTEITTKAGQKCTAIRRIIAPSNEVDAVICALSAKLKEITIGNPADRNTEMGALCSISQRNDVLDKVGLLEQESERVFGDGYELQLKGADGVGGAFMSPVLLHCADPDKAKLAHSIEAFGPVSTVMPYRDIAHAAEILNRADGSLVGSVITHDPQVARDIVVASGAYHGRLYFNDRTSMGESTGHGSPLPHMVHGGPGRAGGGEEMGGVRGVMHYMQRTAIQGSPDIITAVTNQWVNGSKKLEEKGHPFTKTFDAVKIGETIVTELREVTMDDIEHFAHFTGDTFYAHMDEEAAKANPFFPGRVAHGYLLLSFAAGLFVEPNPGPVLANTGLNSLSFQKPVAAGDSIRAHLTVKRKTKRTESYGEVRWNISVTNQDDEQVAEYELLTMNAYEDS